MRMVSKERKKGFSLIELLVVLVIMGLLAGLVGPRIFGNVDKAKVKTAQTQIKMIKGALQTYRLDVGSYPSTEAGLKSLWERPQGDSGNVWQGPYLDEGVPKDPWGNDYQYKLDASETQEFILYSFGADGVAGGDELNSDIGYLPEQ